jgi:hypothetical protein
MQIQMKQMDAQVQANKERAQAEADVLVDEKRLQSDMMIEGQKLDYQAQSDMTDAQLKQMEIQSKREIELLKLGLKDQPEIGSIVTREDERNMAFAEALQGLTMMVKEMAEISSADRVPVRDENGDIIGSKVIRGTLN